MNNARTHLTPRDKINIRRNGWWCAAWAGSMFLMWYLIGQDRGLVPQGLLTWLIAVVPVVIGALVIRSYTRFVREADELQRTIQLNALAISFGVMIIAMTTYPALVRIGAPGIDHSEFAAFGIFLYLGLASFGVYRYR